MDTYIHSYWQWIHFKLRCIHRSVQCIHRTLWWIHHIKFDGCIECFKEYIASLCFVVQFFYASFRFIKAMWFKKHCFALLRSQKSPHRLSLHCIYCFLKKLQIFSVFSGHSESLVRQLLTENETLVTAIRNLQYDVEM